MQSFRLTGNAWLFVAAVVLLIPVVLLIMILAAPEYVDSVVAPDDLTLEEGLEQSIALVDETAATVAPAAQFSPLAFNADPAQARQLKNNYRLSDHSDPDFPGYNDCDSWRNIIDDGWTATYAVKASFADPDEAERMLQAGRQYWEVGGNQVQSVDGRDFSRLWIDTDVAEVQLSVDTRQQTIVLWATTECLPPT